MQARTGGIKLPNPFILEDKKKFWNTAETVIIILALIICSTWAYHDGKMNGKILGCAELNGTYIRDEQTKEMYCYLGELPTEEEVLFEGVSNWSIT